MASKAPSSPTSSTSSTNYDWEVLENNINKKEIDAYIETNIPRSHVYQSNKNVKCHFCVETLNIVNQVKTPTQKMQRWYYLFCNLSSGLL